MSPPAPEADDRAPVLSVDGARATLTLCRPSQHNRIDPSDIAVIRGHVRHAATLPDVRLLVLTGSGHRTFCSGYTLDAIGEQLDDSFEQMIDELEQCPLPTLAALNGAVYGGAADLALACDWRIGVHGMRLMVPAARIGLHYYPSGMRRYVAQLGPAVAKQVLLSAQALHDDTLLRVGYLQELVAADTLAATIDRYESALCATEAGAVASMKQHLNRLAAGERDEAEGRAAYERTRRSPELLARVAALR